MNTLTVLEQAKVRLVSHGWTQCAYARDIHGRKVDEMSDAADRFCLLGAIRAAAGNEVFTPTSFTEAVAACYAVFEEELRPQLWASLIAWHDATERTRDEVLAFLDRVILYESAA